MKQILLWLGLSVLLLCVVVHFSDPISLFGKIFDFVVIAIISAAFFDFDIKIETKEIKEDLLDTATNSPYTTNGCQLTTKNGQRCIVCLDCNRTSYNLGDYTHMYCAHCNKTHHIFKIIY